jgi:hypothetical protein
MSMPVPAGPKRSYGPSATPILQKVPIRRTPEYNANQLAMQGMTEELKTVKAIMKRPVTRLLENIYCNLLVFGDCL